MTSRYFTNVIIALLGGQTLHEIETWRSAHHLEQLHGLVGPSRTAQAEPSQPSLSQAA